MSAHKKVAGQLRPAGLALGDGDPWPLGGPGQDMLPRCRAPHKTQSPETFLRFTGSVWESGCLSDFLNHVYAPNQRVLSTYCVPSPA